VIAQEVIADTISKPALSKGLPAARRTDVALSNKRYLFGKRDKLVPLQSLNGLETSRRRGTSEGPGGKLRFATLILQ
jgi:hypothetical protein